jgi:small conductance mechanosensitive channel
MIELIEKYISAESRGELFARIVTCLVIAVVAVIAQKVGKRAIIKGFSSAKRKPDKKIDTTRSVILGLYKYTVFVLAAFLVLDEFGVNLASLLALAGIGGIAVGIGAQSLVRDILNGVFIWFENQFAVGDTVTLADKTGRVEEFNLRTTKLRGEDGELFIIPNSEIRIVKNNSK